MPFTVSATSSRSGRQFDFDFEQEPTDGDVDEAILAADVDADAEEVAAQGGLESGSKTAFRDFGPALTTRPLEGVFGMLDKAADVVAKATGTQKGGGFGQVAEFMGDVNAEAERVIPVNPENKVANAIGSGLSQGVGLLTGMGALRAAGLGTKAMTALPLGIGAASGAGEGLKTAEEFGIDTPEKALAMGALFGGVEVLTERALGGFGSEQATEALMDAYRKPAGEMLKKAVKTTLGEGVEEPLAGFGQDLITRAFADEDPENPGFTRTGVELPKLTDLEKRKLEMIGGMAGGAVFAGAQIAANAVAPVEGEKADELRNEKAPGAMGTVEGNVAETFGGAMGRTTLPDGRRVAFDLGTLTPDGVQAMTPETLEAAMAAGLVREETGRGGEATGSTREATGSAAPPPPIPGAADPTGAGNVSPVDRGTNRELNQLAGQLATPPAERRLLPPDPTIGSQATVQLGQMAPGTPNRPTLPPDPTGSEDILNWLTLNPILAPKKGDATEGGEYDWREAGEFPPKYRRAIMRAGQPNIDRVAQAAYEEGLINEPTPDALVAEVRSAIENRETLEQGQRQEQQRMQAAEAAQVRFDEEQQAAIEGEGSGVRDEVDADALAVGDRITVGESVYDVIDVQIDEDGRTLGYDVRTADGHVIGVDVSEGGVMRGKLETRRRGDSETGADMPFARARGMRAGQGAAVLEESRDAIEAATNERQNARDQQTIDRERREFAAKFPGQYQSRWTVSRTPDSESARAAERIGRALGVRVVWFHDRGEAGALRGWRSTDRRTIFLNQGLATNQAGRESLAPLNLAAHEIVHVLRVENPKVYDELAAWLKPRLNEGRIREVLLNLGYDPAKGEDLDEEAVAHLAGELAMLPEFHEQLLAEQPGLARRIGEVIRAVLKRIERAFLSGMEAQMAAGGQMTLEEMLNAQGQAEVADVMRRMTDALRVLGVAEEGETGRQGDGERLAAARGVDGRAAAEASSGGLSEADGKHRAEVVASLEEAAVEAEEANNQPFEEFSSYWEIVDTSDEIDSDYYEEQGLPLPLRTWYANANISFRPTQTFEIRETNGKFEVWGENGLEHTHDSFEDAEADAKEMAWEDYSSSHVDPETEKENTWVLFDAFTPPPGWSGKWFPSGSAFSSGSFYGEFTRESDENGHEYKLRISDHYQLSREHLPPDKMWIISAFTPTNVKEAMIQAYDWLTQKSQSRAENSPDVRGSGQDSLATSKTGNTDSPPSPENVNPNSSRAGGGAGPVAAKGTRRVAEEGETGRQGDGERLAAARGVDGRAAAEASSGGLSEAEAYSNLLLQLREAQFASDRAKRRPWDDDSEQYKKKGEILKSISNLAKRAGINFGVREDVVYFDLPTGQVSFHVQVLGPKYDRLSEVESHYLGIGYPKYEKNWDGVKGVSRSRILDAIKANESPTVPQVNSNSSRAGGGAGPVAAKGTRQSQFGERVRGDERMSPGFREAAAATFEVRGQQRQHDEARAIIARMGLRDAMDYLANEDRTRADGIERSVRVAGLMQIAQNYDVQHLAAAARGDDASMAEADILLEQAIEAKVELEILGNESARAVAMYNTWARLSPSGMLERFGRQLRKKQREGLAEDLGVDQDEIGAVVNEIGATIADTQQQATDEILNEVLRGMEGFQPVAIREPMLKGVLGGVARIAGRIAESATLKRLAQAADDALKAIQGRLYSDPFLLTPLAQAALRAVRDSLRAGMKFAAAIEAGLNQAAQETGEVVTDRKAAVRSITAAMTQELVRPILNRLATDTGYTVKQAAADLMEAGVPKQQAQRVAGDIAGKRKSIAKRSKEEATKRLLKKLAPRKHAKLRKQRLPKIIDALMEAGTAGLLDGGVTERQVMEAYTKAFNLPTLTPEQTRKLQRMAGELNKLPEGVLRQDKAREFLNEMALIEGIPVVDLIRATYTANILSGISTQGVNVYGNGIMAVIKGVTAMFSSPREAGKYLKGAADMGLKQGLKEAAAAFRTGTGAKHNLKWDMAQRLNALELLTAQGRPKGAAQWAAMFSSVGGLTRFVYRALGALDLIFFYSANEGMTHLSTARTIRKDQGLKPGTRAFEAEFIRQLGGDETQWQADLQQARDELRAAGQPLNPNLIHRRAYELRVDRRSQRVREQGERWADRLTFQQEPEGSARWLDAIIAGIQKLRVGNIPLGTFLMPFRRVPVNLWENALDFTPIGVARAIKGAHLTGGNKGGMMDTVERRERALSGLIGTTAALILWALDQASGDDDDVDAFFRLYAMGPPDKERRAQMPEGWRPFTFKVGSTYIPWAETPLGPILAAFGAWADMKRYSPKYQSSTLNERMGLALGAALNSYASQGVMKNVAAVMDILSVEPTKNKLGSVLGPVRGAVPAQGLLRDIGTIFDDKRISDDDVWGAIVKDIPVVKNYGTFPDRNWKGEAVTNAGVPIVRRFVTGQKLDPDSAWLGRNRLRVSPMPEHILVGKFTGMPETSQGNALVEAYARRGLQLTALENGAFTRAQWDRFTQRAGKLTAEGVTRLRKQFEAKYPQGRAPEEMQEWLQKQVNAITQAARKTAMLEEMGRVR